MVGTQGYQTVAATSGAVVDVTASGLPLVGGGRYFFAVRAVGQGGSSSEVVSNTVSVVLGNPVVDGGSPTPDGGTFDEAGTLPSDGGSHDGGAGSGGKHSAGCGCSEGAPVGGAAALFALALLFPAAVLRRLRRQR